MRTHTMKTLHYVIARFRPAFSTELNRTAIPLFLIGAGLGLVQPCAGDSFQFEETSSLTVARFRHTATLLSNGQVLVAGEEGSSCESLADAELYDPASGTWSATGSLIVPTFGHTATLLASGKVLVAGGFNNNALNGAELYDPATGAWSSTGHL